MRAEDRARALAALEAAREFPQGGAGAKEKPWEAAKATIDRRFLDSARTYRATRPDDRFVFGSVADLAIAEVVINPVLADGTIVTLVEYVLELEQRVAGAGSGSYVAALRAENDRLRGQRDSLREVVNRRLDELATVYQQRDVVARNALSLSAKVDGLEATVGEFDAELIEVRGRLQDRELALAAERARVAELEARLGSTVETQEEVPR